MTQRVFAAVPVAIVLLAIAVGSALAQTSPGVRVVSRAKIFTRPSTDAPIVSTANVGAVLDVLDHDGQWYWVALAPDPQGVRLRGWVQAANVQGESASDPTEVIRDLSAKVEQLQQQMQALQSPKPPAPRPATNSIPPTAADLRAAKVRREAQAAEDARIAQARQEMEQRQREYDNVMQGRPTAGVTRPRPVPSRPPTRAPYDVFGGYSLLWDNTDGITFPLGWLASLSGNLTDTVAIVGEVSGSYKNADVLGVKFANANIHTFAGGPRFSVRSGSGTVFVQVLGGVAVTSVSVFGIGLPSSTSAAVLPGFGVDLPVARRVAVRVTTEFGFTHSSYGWSNGFRLVSGIVARPSAGR